MTWLLEWKQSRHGPSLVCTWNSSIRWAWAVEADTTRNDPRWSDSSSPAASTGSSATQSVLSRSSSSITS